MKPLKYSEYKIKQGIWLQQEHNSKHTYNNDCIEQTCILMYKEYIEIVLGNSDSFDKEIKKIYEGFDPYKKSHDKNINMLMDNLI